MGRTGLSSHDKKYILAIDEGTSSLRAILFDEEMHIIGKTQYGITQYTPSADRVEHDPDEIWQKQLAAMKETIGKSGVNPSNIASIGITNQRETVVIWDKGTGRALYRAIVWQDRRGSAYTEWLKIHYSDTVKKKTGLIPDPYFSASKIKWLLENKPGLYKKAKTGNLLFGTIDSWLIWNLTGGKVHATDHTNASRTMLYNIEKMEWDTDLLELFRIPHSILPDVNASSAEYGYTAGHFFGTEIPITGVIGDQQAALYGELAHKRGEVKCTYGTGNFVLVSTGSDIVRAKNLLTTIAWSSPGRITYALEGSIFITGAAVQWLRDGIGIINNYKDLEIMAKRVNSSEGLYFVPALTGMGTPYWDPYARGVLIGITRRTTREHIARAVIESEAYLTKEVIDLIEMELGTDIKSLKVDGGGSENDTLMQFQADILNKDLIKPAVIETTSMGAAFVAGITTGYWNNEREMASTWRAGKEFHPSMSNEERGRLYNGWKEAVKRSLKWGSIVEPV
ncbi:MAG: glycerol kinase GlpK [Candidatus Thermoplasmatota archaeon]|jgi:glycerol kinase|nr:glycerol kinase GlpK [Candidatus Thermoplasmatota archaeon]MCL5964149.1 glycerol kinase GlpK [Candidatus Thermoplasmatota archaeon]